MFEKGRGQVIAYQLRRAFVSNQFRSGAMRSRHDFLPREFRSLLWGAEVQFSATIAVRTSDELEGLGNALVVGHLGGGLRWW